MSSIKQFNFPPGLQSFTLGPPAMVPRGTAPLTPDANGQALIDTGVVPLQYLIDNGFTLAPTLVTTSNRPTTNLYPTMQIFDTTLGKPIWRNAANTGWVDATGTSV